MNKMTRIALVTLASAAALVLVAGIAITLLFDPNAYKNQIATLVKDQTGRDLAITGDIKLSLFPWIGASLGAVELGNAPGFGPEPMVRIQSADVKVKLMPLLRRQVQIAALLVDGAQINLGKDKTGKTNWSDLAPSAATPATPTPSAPAEPPGPALAALAIGNIEIRNAALTWHDATTGAKQKVEGLTLRTGPFELGKPTDVALTFNVASNEPPSTANIDVKTRVTVDMQNERYQLDALRMESRFDAKEPAMNGTATLTTSVLADMTKDTLTVTDIRLVANLKQPTANIETQAELTAGLVMGLTSQQLRIEPVKLHAVNTGPAIPGGRAELTASTEISADLIKQTLHIADLAADAFGMKLAGEVRGTRIIDAPSLTGKLAAEQFNLRELLTKLGQPAPDTADPAAMTKASAHLEFTFTPDRLQISELRAQLDQTVIQAQAAVKNFDKPGIEFNVDVDNIDVDRYLPPKSETTAAAASTPTPAATTGASTAPADIPLEPLRALDVKGKFAIGKLKVSGLHAEQLHASIAAKDGLIHIQPLGANLYQGKYTGNIQADARGQKLHVSIDEQLSGIQAGPLLKDLMGDDKFSGAGNVAIKANVAGNNVDAMIAALNGDGSFSLRDGAVKGFNLGKIIRNAQAKLRGEAASADDKVEKTDFSSLDASFQIKDGVASNRDLSLKSPLLRVTGLGSANLPAQEVDYVLTVTVVGTSKGQEGRELDELKGIPIDVKMQGKFADPQFKLDLGAALKAKAKAKVDEEKEKLKQKAEEKIAPKIDEEKKKLEEKAREKLKKLF